MLNLAKIVFFAAAMALLTSSAGATTSDKYYSDQDERGFYWYKDPAEEEPEPETQPQKKPEPPKEERRDQAKPERRIPNLSDYSKEELWNMYPDDLVKLEEDFRKKALQNPSRENVREHLYVKDLARRKSLAYTNSYMMALQTNPELSLERDYSPIKLGNNVRVKMEVEDRKNKLLSSTDDYALVYFYSPSCPYCKEQDKYLDVFTRKYRFNLKKINKDENRVLAERLNVVRTPALILIKKGNEEHIPISNGLVPLDELENRVGQGIRYLAGETTPETWTVKEHERGGVFDAPSPYK